MPRCHLPKPHPAHQWTPIVGDPDQERVMHVFTDAPVECDGEGMYTTLGAILTHTTGTMMADLDDFYPVQDYGTFTDAAATPTPDPYPQYVMQDEFDARVGQYDGSGAVTASQAAAASAQIASDKQAAIPSMPSLQTNRAQVPKGTTAGPAGTWFRRGANVFGAAPTNDGNGAAWAIANANGTGYAGQTAVFVAGETVTVSFEVDIPAGLVGVVSPYLFCRDSGGAAVASGSFQGSVIAAGNGQRVTVSGTLPAGTASIMGGVIVTGPAAGDVGKVIVQRKFNFNTDGATDYADGDTPGWAWAGSQNASASVMRVATLAGLALRALQALRHFEGVGSPEGVVTAPPGATYVDTAVTTGALRWVKFTGTGNTGWAVQFGDTGVRNIDALLANGWTTSVTRPADVRRVGNLVEFGGYFVGTGATTAVPLTLPLGFRPKGRAVWAAPYGLAADATVTTIEVATTGAVNLYAANGSSSVRWVSGSWFTNDAWPTALPGAAA